VALVCGLAVLGESVQPGALARSAALAGGLAALAGAVVLSRGTRP
jgi:hypothetical protein